MKSRIILDKAGYTVCFARLFLQSLEMVLFLFSIVRLVYSFLFSSCRLPLLPPLLYFVWK